MNKTSRRPQFYDSVPDLNLKRIRRNRIAGNVEPQSLQRSLNIIRRARLRLVSAIALPQPRQRVQVIQDSIAGDVFVRNRAPVNLFPDPGDAFV